MSAVMPTKSYPKIYANGSRQYEIHNSAEDTSFQSSSQYFSGISTPTYPKILYIGGREVHVHSSAEETTVRAFFAQS